MQDKKKITILIVISVIMILVWMPKGKKESPGPKQIAVTQQGAIPKLIPAERKRSQFEDWGRNPFVLETQAVPVTVDLSLSGIIWDDAEPIAMINGEMVRVGNKIGGKTVKRIEPNKVIISDGSKEVTLELE